MELLKLLNANELIAQIISFLILLYILRKFLWKPFLAILDKRSEAVTSEFKTIETAKEDLARVRSDYEKRISEIDLEAEARLARAAAEARKTADGIRTKAEAESEKIIANAKSTIKDELGKAKEELKEQIVDITIQIAEKVIQEKLSEDSDRRLVEEFIEGVEKK